MCNSFGNSDIKLSIIIPVYNAQNYIKECVESIINQGCRMEIIMVDDGSDDQSGFICDELAKNSNAQISIKVIHQTNQGPVAARKRGICEAIGEYITFADADDLIKLGTYSQMLQCISNNEADVLACGYSSVVASQYGIANVENAERQYKNGIVSGVYEGEALLQLIDTMHFTNTSLFTFGIFPSMWSKVYRTELLKEFHELVPDIVRLGDDAAITYSAILRSKRVVVNNDICGYCYREVESSITHSIPVLYFEQISALYEFLLKQYSDKLSEQLEYYRAYLLMRGLDWLYDNDNPMPLMKKIIRLKDMVNELAIFSDLDKQLELDLPQEYTDRIKEIKDKKWTSLYCKWVRPRIGALCQK